MRSCTFTVTKITFARRSYDIHYLAQMNGKNITSDNIERLADKILAEAIAYAAKFKPESITVLNGKVNLSHYDDKPDKPEQCLLTESEFYGLIRQINQGTDTLPKFEYKIEISN